MTGSSLEKLARGHSSRRVRFIFRILSIRGITWAMLALSLIATTIVCQQVWRRQIVAQKARFDADAAILRNEIHERLQQYVQILKGSAGLFAASESVEEAEFHAYVDSLDLARHFPEIRAVGFVELVDPSRRDEFLREANHIPRYRESPFRIHPPGERPDYLVVRFVAPFDHNRKALGFDAGSDVSRRRAAMRACDSATAALTSKISLLQASDKPGSVLFQPIYKGGSKPATASERRAVLQGWVYAAFHVDDMMDGVRPLTDARLDYEIFDGTVPSPGKLLSSSARPEMAAAHDCLKETSTLDVFGQPWTLRIQAPPGSTRGSGFLPVGLLATGGICMSLLIFFIGYSMASTGRRALALATEMTAELTQAEQDLRCVNEDLHRSQTKLRTTLSDLQDSHQELERTQLELIQAAKLESVGTLAAGVAHEVKNPLQIIVMGLDYFECRFDELDETSRTTLNDMRDAVLRADSITRELLSFSSSAEFAPAMRDLEVVLERSLGLMKTELIKSGVTLVRNLAGELPLVQIDTRKIQQVLINLILNSLQAMDHLGTLTLTTACGPLEQFLPAHGRPGSPLQPDDQVVILRLVDCGPGIPDAQLPRIFDPFFTTKAVGSGTGLGLSVAKKIMALHDGLMELHNSPEGGLVATLVFAAARNVSTTPGILAGADNMMHISP